MLCRGKTLRGNPGGLSLRWVKLDYDRFGYQPEDNLGDCSVSLGIRIRYIRLPSSG